jgi:oligopeptide transport system substrate-binding protein
MITKFFKIFFIIFVLLYSYTIVIQKLLSKTINLAISSEVESLDPNYSNKFWQINPIENIWTGLFELNASGEIQNAIVESWSFDKDTNTYIFKLKKTLWNDGKPLTANDFLFSYERILNPKNASKFASILYEIKGAKDYNTGLIKQFHLVGVKVLDDYTLKIILEQPDVMFIKKMLHSAYYPIPQHIVKKYGKEWSKVGKIVSNGAYKIVDWKPQSIIILTKNPYYYEKDLVKITDINFYYVGFDVSTEYKMFLSKQLDIANFSSTNIDQVKKNFPNSFYTYPVKTQSYLSINLLNPSNNALLNNQVRKAMAYALDSKYIIDKLQISNIPSSNIVPKLFNDYNSVEPVWVSMKFEDRLKKAKKIMESLGYNDKNRVTIRFNIFKSKNSQDLGILVKDIFKKIYIDLEFYTYDLSSFYLNLEKHNYDIAFVVWIADYDDPSTFFYIMNSNTINNYSGYKNNTFDDLIKKAIIQEDGNKRKYLYNKAEQILYDDLPYLPYATSTRNIVVAEKILNFKPFTIGNNLIKWLDIQ